MATFVSVATAILLAAGGIVAVASLHQATRRRKDPRFKDIRRLNPGILEARPRAIIWDLRDSN